MQTWETIKELTEHPEKKFKRKSNDDFIVSVDSFKYLTGKYSDGMNGNIQMDADWEEIKQPVPFLEAVKAFSEGKTIRCVGMATPQIYKPTASHPHTIPLRTVENACVTEKEILFGEWYIED